MAPMDFLRNNSAGLTQLGLGLLSGKTGTEQAALGAQGLSSALNTNKTVAWLQKTNPELAQAVQSGAVTPGDAWKLAYQQKLEAAKPRNNFMAVGKNIYNTQTGEWVAPPAGVAGADEEEWGLAPVWGTVDGRSVIGQTSKSGKFKQLDTGSFQPTPTITTNNLGTTIEGRNSRTGEPVYSSQVDNAGKKRDEGLGAAQADALQQLGGARATAAQIGKQVEDLKNDEALDSVLGSWDSWTPNILPGAVRAQSKIDQLKGQVFLQGFGMLKGGGAITEVEGTKAEKAMARLNQAQSPEDFKAALDDFNDAVQTGLKKLEAAAQGYGGGAASGAGPSASRTSSGIQWKVE